MARDNTGAGGERQLILDALGDRLTRLSPAAASDDDSSDEVLTELGGPGPGLRRALGDDRLVRSPAARLRTFVRAHRHRPTVVGFVIMPATVWVRVR